MFSLNDDDGGRREGVDSFAQSVNSKAKKKSEMCQLNSLFVIYENCSNDNTNGGVKSIIMSRSSIAISFKFIRENYIAYLHLFV